MRWPWTTAGETPEASEHKREIAEVKERLDDIEEVLADELAVLQRNGDE